MGRRVWQDAPHRKKEWYNGGMLTLFEKEYKKLNSAQKEAVDAIEGPVMVVAGPGTGKTQILTLRIANILLKTQVAGKNILALTFTENAAANMRRRLFSLIGPVAHEISIFTFHGFAQWVRTTYSNFFYGEDFEPISDVERILLIEELIKNLPVPALKPSGDMHMYIKLVADRISQLKRENMDPESFELLLRAKDADLLTEIEQERAGKARKGTLDKLAYEQEKLERLKELNIVYRAYNNALLEQHKYDYEDLLLTLINTLKTNDTLRLIVQERFQYILVDEHQDTNRSQNEIVELIAAYYENPNLFVVGDIKQAIYRFQGASVTNFTYFQKKYPKSKVVYLTENYRSSRRILEAVFPLFPKEKELTAKSKRREKPIVVAALPTEVEEYAFIKTEIDRILKENPKETVGILVKTNEDARTYSQALQKLGVPAYSQVDEPVLEDTWVKKLLVFLRAMTDPRNDTYLLAALQLEPFGIPLLERLKLLQLARKSKVPLYECCFNKQSLVEAMVMQTPQAQRFLELIEVMDKRIPFTKPSAILQACITEIGFPPKELTKEAFVSAQALYLLVEEARAFEKRTPEATIKDFLLYLKTAQLHKVVRDVRTPQAEAPVTAMTVHKAKGLEFDNVFVVNATDERWGKPRRSEKLKLPAEVFLMGEAREDEDELEEEKRLFYVALTRAKHELFITYPQEDVSGKIKTVSPLVAFLKDELKEERTIAEKDKDKLSTTVVSQLSPAPLIVKTAETEAFFRGLLSQYQLSATGLNAYLACPLTFVYEHLLGIRKPAEPVMVQGTAAHDLLSYVYMNLMQNKPFSTSDFAARVQEIFAREPLDLKEHDIKRLEQEVVDMVTAYLKEYGTTLAANVRVEERFNKVTVDGVPFLLTGRLDKIELHEGNTAVIVDYKAREPMSRNEILGLTAKGDKRYYYQLVFYHMLVLGSRRYQPIAVELDFLKPNKSGKYKKERFEISESDVQELKGLITQMYLELEAMAFADKHCGDKECVWCNMGV